MKKIFAFVCAASLFLLTSCGSVPAEEPFSADFEITKTSEVLTSKVFINNYNGETHIYDSDSINYYDIEQFFKSTVFSADSDTLILPQKQVKIALTGIYTQDDISSLSEIIETLNSVSSFYGIREVTADEADFTIEFTADDGQPTREERYAEICQHIMLSIGFNRTCDTVLDSCLGGADFITSTDLYLIELLYTHGENGMSEQDFFTKLRKHFNNTEDLS